MTYRITLLFCISLLLSGCPLDGDNGNIGLSGINCWDLNGNRINDADEDTNQDGLWTAKDCQITNSPAQSQEAVLNHQHFCQAFAALNEYPDGCPSDTHLVPSGNLTIMTSGTFYDDVADGYESCANNPSNGLLSIKYKPSENLSYFVLEGGYIADQSTMGLTEVIDNNSCFNECKNDPNCIASLASKKTIESFECYTFYHSDTISQWEQLCGVSFPNTEPSDLCISALADQRWSVKCP